MADRRESAVDIATRVAALHGVGWAAILAPGGARRIVAARHDAIRAVRDARPEFSLAEIGRVFDRGAKTILQSLRRTQRPRTPAPAEPAIAAPSAAAATWRPGAREIGERIAGQRGYSWAEIRGRARDRQLVAARHDAIRAVREARPDFSLSHIGRVFNLDHTTVLHALRKTAGER